MKKIIINIMSIVCVMLLTSCDDFLTTYPKDALSPSTTWNTEADAQSFLVGCYNGWQWGEEFFYLDCTSDIGFSYHTHEGFRVWGNGTMNSSGANLTGQGSLAYNYSLIRKCDHYLANIDKVTMDEAKKKDFIAQVRLLRAYRYFKLNWWYGGCAIIPLSGSASEAQLPRETEEAVRQHVFDEIDAALNGGINEKPAAAGYIAKGFGLALKMRSALYYEDYGRALQAAKDIVALGQYELHGDFGELFSYAGKSSPEIILSVQKVKPSANEWIVTVPNNADGGWSSIVPTQNLIDMYEMANGLTKEETGSGYDPAHPFAGRDPRMNMTVLVPGIDWPSNYEGVLNTLDGTLPDGNKNPNHPLSADNASKTGLTWAKFLVPLSQYGGDLYSTETQYIVFRYAEVLLTLAEASNELNGPSAEAWDALDQIRVRAGMPVVDRAKYGTKETLRELIRRERSVELAGEGHRRSDIMRWKDASGKMVAETVLNADLKRITGTINYAETDPFKRAVVNARSQDELIENRKFAVHNRYLPITQGNIDRNPQLKQNPGY